MQIINVNLEGEGAWPDLAEKEVIHLGQDAPAIEIATLDAGMKSGAPSLAIRLDLPDGRVVLVETSVNVFLVAAAAVRARYPQYG